MESLSLTSCIAKASLFYTTIHDECKSSLSTKEYVYRAVFKMNTYNKEKTGISGLFCFVESIYIIRNEVTYFLTKGKQKILTGEIFAVI